MFTTFSFILIFRISYIHLHHSHPSSPLHFNPSHVSACLPLLIFSFYPHLSSSSSLCIVGENHSPSLNSHWLPQALHLRWVFKCSLSVLVCWLTGVVVMQVCFWLFHDVSNLLNVAIVVFFLLTVLFWVKNPFPLLYLQFLRIYLLHDPFYCQGFPLEFPNWGIDIFNSILI